MLLIISGPQGPGKRIIAEKIQHSTGATLYSEMPPTKPADLPSEGLVIITTDNNALAEWICDTNYAIVSQGYSVLYSRLEYDVHPFEWVSALLADYKTLREKATAAGIENDDPVSEMEMLGNVERFCSEAAKISVATPLPTAEAFYYEQLFCSCPSCGEQIDILENSEKSDLPEFPFHVVCPECTISFTVTKGNRKL